MGDIPVDNFLVVPPDVVLLFWRDDTQSVLLAGLRFGIDHICAQVHVDSALR